jgi:hypothetical protein
MLKLLASHTLLHCRCDHKIRKVVQPYQGDALDGRHSTVKAVHPDRQYGTAKKVHSDRQ